MASHIKVLNHWFRMWPKSSLAPHLTCSSESSTTSLYRLWGCSPAIAHAHFQLCLFLSHAVCVYSCKVFQWGAPKCWLHRNNERFLYNTWWVSPPQNFVIVRLCFIHYTHHTFLPMQPTTSKMLGQAISPPQLIFSLEVCSANYYQIDAIARIHISTIF